MPLNDLKVFVGYDEREAVGFPVFCHSVLSRTKANVSFTPVRGTRINGSTTAFDRARWDVPRLCNYRGLALWAECDMLVRSDLSELLELAHGSTSFDVMLVKHEYQTKFPIKFLGQKNENYPRKNWSSFMLMDCGSAAWRRLDEFRAARRIEPGDIHRFPERVDGYTLFAPGRVQALAPAWNHLVGEYPYSAIAKVAHFTIGLPCFPEYLNCDYAEEWFEERRAMMSHA